MQCDKEKREVTHAGLLEKYVLGLCNSSEQEEFERLINSNPEIADQIAQMKKAVKCYCTSCHSSKVKSILRGKNESSPNPKFDINSERIGLSHHSKGVFEKTLAFVRELIPIKF